MERHDRTVTNRKAVETENDPSTAFCFYGDLPAAAVCLFNPQISPSFSNAQARPSSSTAGQTRSLISLSLGLPLSMQTE